MCKTVIVEGIIGAGKSSLSAELAPHLGENTLYLTEPDEVTNPYLADYYADPDRWAFAIQMHLLSERYRMHLQAQWHVMNNSGSAILDRSYFGDVAFAWLQLDRGHMTRREFDTYQRIYKAMTAGVLFPNVCIHLVVSPETAKRRIGARMEQKEGRKCEVAIEDDYLIALDKEIGAVCEVLQQMGTKVLHIPWDEERKTKGERDEFAAELGRKIRELEIHDQFPDFHRRLTTPLLRSPQ